MDVLYTTGEDGDRSRGHSPGAGVQEATRVQEKGYPRATRGDRTGDAGPFAGASPAELEPAAVDQHLAR